MSQRRRQTSSILIRLCRHTWSERHHGIREVEDESGKVKFEYSIDKNSADHFCRYLLGQSTRGVDIAELNRDQEQVGRKKQ
jgi:hypothetical protein